MVRTAYSLDLPAQLPRSLYALSLDGIEILVDDLRLVMTLVEVRTHVVSMLTVFVTQWTAVLSYH